MDIKEKAIHDTEVEIDRLRKQRVDEQAILDEIVRKEDEARDFLRLLKTGKPEGLKSKKLTSHDDYLEAIGQFDGGEFLSSELASIIDVSVGAAGQKLRNMVKSGDVEITYPGNGPGDPRRYKSAPVG